MLFSLVFSVAANWARTEKSETQAEDENIEPFENISMEQAIKPNQSGDPGDSISLFLTLQFITFSIFS